MRDPGCELPNTHFTTFGEYPCDLSWRGFTDMARLLELFGRQLEDGLDLRIFAGEAAERLELCYVDASVLVQLVTDVEANHPADDQMVGAELEHPVQKTLHAHRRLLYPRSRDGVAGSRSQTRLLKLVGLGRMAPGRLVHRVREGQGYDVDHELSHLRDVAQGVFGVGWVIRTRTHAYAEHGRVAVGSTLQKVPLTAHPSGLGVTSK